MFSSALRRQANCLRFADVSTHADVGGLYKTESVLENRFTSNVGRGGILVVAAGLQWRHKEHEMSEAVSGGARLVHRKWLGDLALPGSTIFKVQIQASPAPGVLMGLSFLQGRVKCATRAFHVQRSKSVHLLGSAVCFISKLPAPSSAACIVWLLFVRNPTTAIQFSFCVSGLFK